MIGSVRRAIALLRCFTAAEPELSVTQLSRKLGVHKSTVSRILATLRAEGLVDRNPATGEYRLGLGLLELSGLVALHADMRQVARPFLRRLSEATRETVNLAVLEGNESLNIEQAVSHHRRVTGFGWVGRKTPLHASSTGKVLLANLPVALAELKFTPLTHSTITEVETMHEELDEIRERGYATGLEELEVGLHAVAAPVRDHSGEVVAAISVTGPSPRLSEWRIHQEVAPQVISCAVQISEALGYRVPLVTMVAGSLDKPKG